MFLDIPSRMLERMHYLEKEDARDRIDETPHRQRLRQVPPETGRFLALLAASAPEGDLLEVGTSGGYSTMWLTRAAQLKGKKITTFEILPEKAHLAQETFREAGVTGQVDQITGDARQYLPGFKKVAFIFLDAEKSVYMDCYDLVIPNLVPGGLLLADNVISHQEELQPFLDRVLADDRVDALVVPIGKGVLLSRKR